ncbi:chorion peroxidase-like [Watersipora subatra]|uniref:chorion peroxidase-like n=1 Tax=Watersipora subatra TaxID=2589382 RepID=UPI00355C08CC
MVYERSQTLKHAVASSAVASWVERFQINDLTAYVDGSQIYGSVNNRAGTLRIFLNGTLKSSTGVNNETNLPLNPNNPGSCKQNQKTTRFFSGDVRSTEQENEVSTSIDKEVSTSIDNEVSTSVDNEVSTSIDKEVSTSIDNEVSTSIDNERITYQEFLPEVVGPVAMEMYNLKLLNTGRFTSYSSDVDSSILNKFSTAVFRFRHPLIGQSFRSVGSEGQRGDLAKMFDVFKTVEQLGEYTEL